MAKSRLWASSAGRGTWALFAMKAVDKVLFETLNMTNDYRESLHLRNSVIKCP